MALASPNPRTWAAPKGIVTIGLGLALVAAAPPARTSVGYLSANNLVARCTEDSVASASYCLAFIAGVRDAAIAYEIWNKRREFCMPPAASQIELRDVFLREARNDPVASAGQAASVVILALKKAFPCAG